MELVFDKGTGVLVRFIGFRFFDFAPFGALRGAHCVDEGSSRNAWPAAEKLAGIAKERDGEWGGRHRRASSKACVA